jgi:DNA-binding NarL/FixJ family response regulator
MRPVRIVLADDHPILRESLREALDREEGIEVLADVGDGRAAVEAVKAHAPDVAILDITMPELNGIDAARAIREASPDTAVVCLSVHGERGMVTAMLRAGATGYVLKSAASGVLLEAVRTVAAGKTYLCSEVADDIRKQHVDGGDGGAFEALTPREREILQLLAEGLHVKGIAARLGISPKTVFVHRANIMRKIDADSMADVVRYAVREGMSEL